MELMSVMKMNDKHLADAQKQLEGELAKPVQNIETIDNLKQFIDSTQKALGVFKIKMVK